MSTKHYRLPLHVCFVYIFINTGSFSNVFIKLYKLLVTGLWRRLFLIRIYDELLFFLTRTEKKLAVISYLISHIVAALSQIDM